MITKGKMSSYNTNTSENPVELARENMTSVHVKITCFTREKITVDSFYGYIINSAFRGKSEIV